jgi:PhnB protein
MSPVKAIPEGYHAITPSLICKDCAKAIEFYKKAFGATELMRSHTPDGSTITHCELKIGDSIIFVNDEMGPGCAVTPGTVPGVSMYLYVQNADATFNSAIAAGAKVDMPLADMFWGDRFGTLTDPYGHSWGVATHVEDLTPEEIGKRAAAFFAKMAKAAS